MDDSFFRQLSSSEEQEFRQWARDNFNPQKDADPCWHPCVRDEWNKLKHSYEPKLRTEDMKQMMERLEWCYDAIPRAAVQQLNIVATVSYDKEQKRFWISDQSSGRAWWADFNGSELLKWTFTEVIHND